MMALTSYMPQLTDYRTVFLMDGFNYRSPGGHVVLAPDASRMRPFATLLRDKSALRKDQPKTTLRSLTVIFDIVLIGI
jgi:hypothetical protein